MFRPNPFPRLCLILPAVVLLLAGMSRPSRATSDEPRAGLVGSDPLGIGSSKGVLRAVVRLSEGQVPRPGRTVRVEVQLVIADGWHVYANPPGDPSLIPTVIQVSEGGPITLDTVRYPDGVAQGSEPGAFGLGAGVGSEALIYKTGTRIPVLLKISDEIDPGLRPVTLRLRYQACNDQACRPPTTLELPVKLRVASR